MMRSRKTAAGLFFALCMGMSFLSISSPAKSATPEKTIAAVQQKIDVTNIKDLDNDIQKQVICLALNLYHEARGSSADDIMAVGLTTRNRVNAANSDYCSIIWQKGQYVWTKRPIRGQMPRDYVTWSKIIIIAAQIVTVAEMDDITGGADSFYSRHIHAPRWAMRSPIHVRIGGHVFVKQFH